MSNSNSKLSEIEQGIDQLVSKISSLNDLVKSQEEKIEMLTEKNNNFSEKNERLEILNQELEEKVKKTGESSGSDVPEIDTEAYNHKINELVKEINACISLLNK